MVNVDDAFLDQSGLSLLSLQSKVKLMMREYLAAAKPDYLIEEQATRGRTPISSVSGRVSKKELT